MAGRAELQGGAVMLLVGVVGLAALRIWGTGATPTGTGNVFTAHGFVSAVSGFMFVGVAVIGALLIALGAVLRVVQRAREAKRES